MPHIGKLDQYISIYKIEKTRDSTGQNIIAKGSKLADSYCRVAPMTGRERFTSGRELAVRRYKMIIRFIPDITEEMIVEWQGDDYDIIGLAPMGKRNAQWLEICVEYRRETGIRR